MNKNIFCSPYVISGRNDAPIKYIALIIFALCCSLYMSTASALDQIEAAKLIASDGGTGDQLGISVSVDGDTALVGAYNDDDIGNNSGAVYVFSRSGSTWIQEAKLKADDATAGGRFGHSVHLDSDTALIGSSGGTGAVYMFTRSGTNWSQEAKLTASDANSGQQFGTSLSQDGDTLLIGSWQDNDLGGSSGSAYIFTRIGSSWIEQDKLTASDGVQNDRFGFSVDVDGETAVIGAFGVGGFETGAAYVFVRNGSIWSEQAKLTATDASFSRQFGASVYVNGDVALIGSSGGSGSVYVFNRSGTMWTEQTQLTSMGGAGSSHFGISIAGEGDEVLIGANVGVGSAYLFVYNGSVWSQQENFIASDGLQNDLFGHSVSFDGNTALVGAFLAGASEAGAAYVFNLDTNESPVADAGGPYLVPIGENIAFDGSGSFDPDSTNILTETWIADGGTVNGSVYTAGPLSGIYGVSLTVNDGQVDSQPAITTVVVYDPSGGFVTGGGWIDSQPGAYSGNDQLSGKANFGFVSKYKKGASIPTGETMFKFTAGDLNFHSDSYQWLVVNQNGARAQYKGDGTINGNLAPTGEAYKFMLWAGDGDHNEPAEADTFRIKIWYDDGSEVVVYDNVGEQAIGGGSIVIHTGKKK